MKQDMQCKRHLVPREHFARGTRARRCGGDGANTVRRSGVGAAAEGQWRRCGSPALTKVLPLSVPRFS